MRIKGLFKKATAVALTTAMAAAGVVGLNAKPVLAGAKEPVKGKLYCNFRERTSVDELEVGKDYIFLGTHYNDGEAVIDLPSGSAVLRFAGKFDASKKVKDEYWWGTSYYYDGDEIVPGSLWEGIEMPEYMMLSEEGNEDDMELSDFYAGGMQNFYDGAVIVVERGTGFDSCLAGTIAYMKDDDIDLVWCGKKDVSEMSFEEYCNRPITESLSGWEYDNAINEYGLTDDATYLEYLEAVVKKDYEEYLEWATEEGEEILSFEEYIEYDWGISSIEEYARSRYNREYIEIVNGRYSWRYGCDGGGVSYVGPMYLYEYDTEEFTADDITVKMKSGFEVPATETVVSTDSVIMYVTIKGVEYAVPGFTILPENNTLSVADNDYTITVEFGGVTKEIVVGEAKDSHKNFLDGATESLDTIEKVVLEDGTEYTITENDTLVLVVDELDDADIPEADKEAVDKIKAEVDGGIAFDAYLLLNGTHKVEPDGSITITIKVPEFPAVEEGFERTIILYHIVDGVANKVGEFKPAEDGTITFTVDSCSTFVIAYADSEVNTDIDTGDSSVLGLAIAMVVAAGVCVTFARRRRFANVR